MPHPRPTRRDAATREGRRCPRVRPRPAASCHKAFIFLKPTHADSHRRGSGSGRFARNRADLGLYRLESPKRPIQAEIQKKKKKVQNAPFELNIKPSFSSLHTNTPNSALCLSLSSSLTRLSLSLCSLPLSLLVVRHSASAESVT